MGDAVCSIGLLLLLVILLCVQCAASVRLSVCLLLCHYQCFYSVHVILDRAKACLTSLKHDGAILVQAYSEEGVVSISLLIDP